MTDQLSAIGAVLLMGWAVFSILVCVGDCVRGRT